jgi:cell shape-determining protein MreC
MKKTPPERDGRTTTDDVLSYLLAVVSALDERVDYLEDRLKEGDDKL